MVVLIWRLPPIAQQLLLFAYHNWGRNLELKDWTFSQEQILWSTYRYQYLIMQYIQYVVERSPVVKDCVLPIYGKKKKNKNPTQSTQSEAF